MLITIIPTVANTAFGVEIGLLTNGEFTKCLLDFLHLYFCEIQQQQFEISLNDKSKVFKDYSILSEQNPKISRSSKNNASFLHTFFI